MTCPPSPQTINSCTGTFYDGGGAAANYPNNQNCVYTFCSNSPGECLMLNFTSFNVTDMDFFGNPYDYMTIYDGPSTASPYMFDIWGGPFPTAFPVASSSTCLTIQFISDNSIRTSGWSAVLNCQPCPIPTSPNQQDCNGAIPICQEQYYQPYSYSGNNGSNILPASSCIFNELNNSWYVFTAQTSGPLSFIITPNFSNDDYDWSIYDISNNGCAGITSGASPEISCNWSENYWTWAGQTGAYSGPPYNGVGNSQTNTGPPFNASPNVIAGNTYALVINNFSPSQGGYYLDLSPSTASLFDNTVPIMETANTVACGANTVTVNFSEPILCSTIQAADFTITGGPPTTVAGAVGVGCGGAGTYTQAVTLTASPAFAGGTFNINLVGNVADLCGNIATGTLSFSLSTFSNAGTDFSLCGLTTNLAGNIPAAGSGVWTQVSSSSGGTTIFGNNASASSGITVSLAGIYTYQWTVTNGACVVSDQVVVTFTPPPVATFTYPTPICKNSANPSPTFIGSGFAGVFSSAPAGLNFVSTATGQINLTTTTAGTYTITNTIAASGSCPLATATFVIVINTAPPLSIVPSPASATTCQGVSTVLLTASPNNFAFGYVWSPAAGLSGTIGFNVVANPAVATTYTVVGTAANGCTSSASILVNVSAPSNAGTNGTITLCSNGSPVNLFSSLGGTPQATGAWSGPSALAGGNLGTYTPGVSLPGTYTYTVPGTAPCPNASATVVVTQNSAPVAGTNGSVTLCTTSSTVSLFSLLGGTPQASGAWSGPSVLPGGNLGNFNPALHSGGLYTYTVTGTAPCSNATATVLVTLNTAVNAGINGSITLCSSGTTVDLFTSLTGAPQNTGVWSGPSAIGGGYLGSFNPAIHTAGTYTYTVSGTAPCPNSTATVAVTINNAVNAGISATLSLCSSAAPVDLFAGLTGSPQNSGTWSGPSALGGGYLGTFNPAIHSAGTYTYTVTGTAPCLNSAATVGVTINAPVSTTLTYPGSPFCTNFAGTVNPVIAGITGGSFSALPAGLTMNGAGVITPSTSSAGTYTITYQVPASGGCPSYTINQTVVINALPAPPTLNPNPPCAGSSVNFTAGGGSMYEYFLNGASQGAPAVTNTISLGPLVTGDQICVNSYPSIPINFNGLITEAEWGAAISTSAGGPASSGFGVGNNLDALFLKNSSGYFYGALAGNVVNGSNNRLLLFIDCQPGGFNNLGAWVSRSNAPYYSVENLNNITFDAGFTPEYILAMNQAAGNSFFDLYNMVTNTNNYLGDGTGSPWLGFVGNAAIGDNSKGFEFGFPMAALGNPTVSVKVFAMLVNNPGTQTLPNTTLSNQFLTPCGPAELNYGNGTVNFSAAAPDPIQYALSADCFSQTCVTTVNTITPTFSFPVSLCNGASAPSLPPVSDNGIAGTWSPVSINNTSNGSYTFTPTGGCATSVSINITVVPNPSLTPIHHD